jgi:hypothetical protein
MSHPPDSEMRRGGPPQATPEFTHSQPEPYHVPLDLQVFIAASAPCCVAVLLLSLAGGRL